LRSTSDEFAINRKKSNILCPTLRHLTIVALLQPIKQGGSPRNLANYFSYKISFVSNRIFHQVLVIGGELIAIYSLGTIPDSVLLLTDFRKSSAIFCPIPGIEHLFRQVGLGIQQRGSNFKMTFTRC
ncbi:hypothetical protein SFRURICE_006865, partial [Spodoptera frugiperda]